MPQAPPRSSVTLERSKTPPPRPVLPPGGPGSDLSESLSDTGTTVTEPPKQGAGKVLYYIMIVLASIYVGFIMFHHLTPAVRAGYSWARTNL